MHINVKFKTRKSALAFVRGLPLRAKVGFHVIDDSTGEIILDKGQSRKDFQKALSRSYRGLTTIEEQAPLSPMLTTFLHLLSLEYRDEWERLNAKDFEAFYHIVEKDMIDFFNKEEAKELLEGGYDLYWPVPRLIRRKDGLEMTEEDTFNMKQYISFRNDYPFPINIKLTWHLKSDGRTAQTDFSFC